MTLPVPMPRRPLRRPSFRVLPALALAMAIAACGRSTQTPGPSAPTTQTREARNLSLDPTPIFRQMGMIARGFPFPVVGRVAYLPSASPDTTHVTVVLGFAPGVLRFTRETDTRYRASYTVALGAESGGRSVYASEVTEQVVVGAFRETERGDESLLYQEILDLPPGVYRLTIAIRDVSSQRGIVETVELTVPSFAARTLSTPLPINRVVPRGGRDSLPYVLARPRATAAFGIDSVLPVYLESTAPADTALTLVARGESGRILWQQPVRLEPQRALASGVVQVPVARLGVGVSQLAFVGASARDTANLAVFVGFGDDLPIAGFEDMLRFLRYFARPQRIAALRAASEEDRAAAWGAFLAETDSVPETPVHEDLRAYFLRLMQSNTRFREDGVSGWLSDRGRVFIVLGEPDQILEPSFTGATRARQQFWEYRRLNLQLQFYDQSGTGRWRLAPSSETRFDTEMRRLQR